MYSAFCALEDILNIELSGVFAKLNMRKRTWTGERGEPKVEGSTGGHEYSCL